MAVDFIRSQRDLLSNLIRHCPSLAESLYSKSIISGDVREKACNQSLGSSERGGALLDCVEARVMAVPSDFAKVVNILEAEPYLRFSAEELVKSYCE